MSSTLDQQFENKLSDMNITTRRLTGLSKKKMALDVEQLHLTEEATSLLVESILSKDEEMDVISMLNFADELGGMSSLTGFFTSTQMGKREPRYLSTTPPLSPVPFAVEHNRPPYASTGDGVNIETVRLLDAERLNKVNLIDGMEHNMHADGKNESFGREASDEGQASQARLAGVTNLDLNRPEVVDPIDPIDLIHDSGAAPLTQAIHDAKTTTMTPTDGGLREGDGRDGRVVTPTGDEGVKTDSDAEIETDDEGSDKSSNDEENKANKYMNQTTAANRLAQIDDLLHHLNTDSATLADTVKTLENSLEFSYKEIADLKRENANLKQKLGSLETEDKRTQFQVRDVAEKLDRLDSITKKKNLIFDGVQESEGRREETDKVIGRLFDQLQVGKGIEFEACYRVGPYSKSRPRSILVSFNRQSDRDLVYSRRMDLNRTADFQRVWMNEDISPASRRKREIIKLISREARDQGTSNTMSKTLTTFPPHYTRRP